MYQDLLGRTPAQAEVDGWVQAMDNGLDPTQVAYGFAASAEREGIRVRADYQTFLGRDASDAEVAGWVDAFRHGLTNEDVISGFVGSPEYFDNGHKGAGDKGTWVTHAFLDVLHRPATLGEVDSWSAFLT